jgi:peroxiredoxin
MSTVIYAADIPRPVPDFKFRTMGGKEESLSQFKGEPVVLEFLLTWCSHCQQCSQIMNRLSGEYAAKGVQMLGVAIGEGDDKKFGLYAQQYGINFPVGYNTDRAKIAGFLQHPVMAQMMMPQLVFIDRNGVIRGQFRGDDANFFGSPADHGATEEKNMRAEIEKLIAPAVSKKATAKKAPAQKKT